MVLDSYIINRFVVVFLTPHIFYRLLIWNVILIYTLSIIDNPFSHTNIQCMHIYRGVMPIQKYQKRFKLQTNANNSKRENTNKASLKSGLHHCNRETHRGCSFAFSCPVLYFSFPLYQNHNSTRRANRKNDQSGLPKPQIHSTYKD